MTGIYEMAAAATRIESSKRYSDSGLEGHDRLTTIRRGSPRREKG